MKARRVAVLIVLALGAVVFVCLSKRGGSVPQDPSAIGHRQFTEAFADALHSEMPTARTEIRDDFAVVVKPDSGNYQSFVVETKNAWRASRDAPNQRDREIRDLVAIVKTMMQTPSTVPANTRTAHFLPAVRHTEFVHNSQVQYGKGYDGIHEPFTEDLCLLYVEQTASSLRFLTERDLSDLHLDTKGIRDLAFSNLRGLAPKAKWVELDHCFALQIDGTNESSMLALDEFWASKLPPVKGDVMAIVPDRDLLVITGSDMTEGVAHLRTIAEKMFREARHPISKSIYVWKAGKWRVAE